VSLEHFKKQVLLLHGEQSTLDNLSSGFNDRYTVHCATTGSEALNTLGETRIDVIVTAQDLPGMSGLDALREAKKRSPETIGILLAGKEDHGLEALVGDQEVFQIVRGTVTADSLTSLIDNATRQARLLALAESANDTTANPDEPIAEHIVMETSENGSAIVSDGTGRVPVLNPQKISVAAGVGSRAVDVLVLTRDDDFLTTVQESALGLHNVIYANTLAQADDAIRTHRVGVAIVDAAMVGSDVEKLTMHLRSQAPRLVAIVAGRRDDGEMLMDLINRGKVYRFLLKPVSPGRSRLAIEASVKHHLEAADTAFKVPGDAEAVTRAVAAPEAKQRKPEPPKPAPVAKAAVPAAKPNPAPAIVASPDDALSPIDDGLSHAFAENDTSFMETVARFFSSAARSFSSIPAAGSGGSLLSNRKILGMGAAALVVISGLSFWIFGGSDEPAVAVEPPPSTPSFTEVDPVFETVVVTPEASGADHLIDEAQLAATAGQIYNPPGSNAIELYLSALEAAPGDPVAQAGLNDVVEQALSMAETAMLEHRSEDATAVLERVELADPDNPRLPFLNAQLAQTQLRSSLDNVRLAIRESRFEDAKFALDGARSLAIADTTEIDAVADELNAALSNQRVDEVLAQANARLEEGNLIAPSNDNARFYYELALSNDPDNTAARQGLSAVASKLVLQARAQIDRGNFDAANDLLIDARRLDPSSSELAVSASALSAARDRQAQDQRRVAEQRAAAERAATERAAAEKAAAERAAADKVAAEQAAAEKLAAERDAAEKATADKVAAEQAAAEKLAAERDAAEKAAAEQLQAAAATHEQAAIPAPISSSPVSLSSLKRTKYVAPKYPRAAQRRNLTGWVDVMFTVDIDGTVTDIGVRDSSPGDTFVGSATKAVEGWEFEPVIEDGVAIRTRAAVRMMFALE